jgi:hypothetical protein
LDARDFEIKPAYSSIFWDIFWSSDSATNLY